MWEHSSPWIRGQVVITEQTEGLRELAPTRVPRLRPRELRAASVVAAVRRSFGGAPVPGDLPRRQPGFHPVRARARHGRVAAVLAPDPDRAPGRVGDRPGDPARGRGPVAAPGARADVHVVVPAALAAHVQRRGAVQRPLVVGAPHDPAGRASRLGLRRHHAGAVVLLHPEPAAVPVRGGHRGSRSSWPTT